MMNRRSFLKASASAAVMGSAGGSMASGALSLSGQAPAALSLHDVIFNIDPIPTPALGFSEELLKETIRECWDNGGEAQLITFEDDHEQDDT